MADPAAPTFWNVPNSLTVGRLGLSVVVFVLIGQEQWFAALVVFGLAALSDALDGYLARKLNQETPLGRQLDPLVDKVIVAGCYSYLLTFKETGLQPWMVTAIVGRELIVTGLRGIVESAGHQFPADWFGKAKMVLQCAVLIGILLQQSLLGMVSPYAGQLQPLVMICQVLEPAAVAASTVVAETPAMPSAMILMDTGAA